MARKTSLKHWGLRILALVLGLQWLKIGPVKGYDVVALVLLGILICDYSISGKVRRALSFRPVAATSLLVLGMLLALCRGSFQWPQVFLEDLLEVTRVIVGISIMLFIVITVDTRQKVEDLLKWIVIGGLISFVVAFPSFVAGFYHGEYQHAGWLGSRFAGTSKVPNYYAVYSAVVVAVSLGLLLLKEVNVRIWMRLGAICAILVGATYVVSSGSRTGFISMASAVFPLMAAFPRLLWKKRVGWLLVIVGLVVIVAITSGLSPKGSGVATMISRLQHLTSNQARHLVWPYIICNIIPQNLLCGVGFVQVAVLTHEGLGIYNISHNLVLQALAVAGVWGAGFLLLIGIELAAKGYSVWRRSRSLFFLLCLALLPTLVGSIMLDFLQVRWAWFVVGLCLADLCKRAEANRSGRSEKPR